MSFGIAILRAVVGGFFIGHGLQKLLGKFGGHGLDGTAGFIESLGLRPGKVHATAAGVAETGGGALLVARRCDPARRRRADRHDDRRHPEGPPRRTAPWVANGGYEYNAVLVAALFAITAGGPGAFSIDRRSWGTPWALAALAGGAAGAYAMLELAKRTPEPDAGRAHEQRPAGRRSAAGRLSELSAR